MMKTMMFIKGNAISSFPLIFVATMLSSTLFVFSKLSMEVSVNIISIVLPLSGSSSSKLRVSSPNTSTSIKNQINGLGGCKTLSLETSSEPTTRSVWKSSRNLTSSKLTKISTI